MVIDKYLGYFFQAKRDTNPTAAGSLADRVGFSEGAGTLPTVGDEVTPSCVACPGGCCTPRLVCSRGASAAQVEQ